MGIFDCRLPIADYRRPKLETGNSKLDRNSCFANFEFRISSFCSGLTGNRQSTIENRQLLRLALVILALSFSLACGSKSNSEPARIFPLSNEVQGWAKVSETRSFPPDRLYEYIDGDADKYIQAGVGQTLTADYRYGGKIDAVVDIFVMAQEQGATGVFESQPAIGSQPVRLGDAGRLYRGSVTFRKGRCYVRLVAFTDSAEVPSALLSLGAAIATRCGGYPATANSEFLGDTIAPLRRAFTLRMHGHPSSTQCPPC